MIFTPELGQVPSPSIREWKGVALRLLWDTYPATMLVVTVPPSPNAQTRVNENRAIRRHPGLDQIPISCSSATAHIIVRAKVAPML